MRLWNGLLWPDLNLRWQRQSDMTPREERKCPTYAYLPNTSALLSRQIAGRTLQLEGTKSDHKREDGDSTIVQLTGTPTIVKLTLYTYTVAMTDIG